MRCEISIHVMPAGSCWVVRRTDAKRAWRSFNTKHEAARAAARIFPRNHLKIFSHGADGRIERRVLRAATK